MALRRSLVAASLLTLGLAWSASAWSQALQMRISHAAAESDWLHKSMLLFKENIEKALPGQIAVSVHGASSLFRQGTEVPALQRGNLEMSTMTTFEVEQQLPEYGILSSGYLFRDYDHLAKVMRGPIGKEYYDAVAAKMGIQIIEVSYLGTRQINLRQAKDVKTPADLAGVKLRMPAGPGWLALGKGLGVSPTPMAMPEVYLSMKTGTIDGQENPLGLAKNNNLHEVSQQFVLTSHLVQPVFYAIAKPFWDKLSPAQQEALRKAARESSKANDDAKLAEEKQMVDFFLKAGLKVTTPDLNAFRASVDKQYQESGLAAKWMPGLKEKILAVK
ncbi:MAG: TRAP transporter substrate-binding protein DctP [Rhodoferax sp.]|jgi:tripartite ATP-independent transporter DctP family solute receptor|nr:TRAP transporter substrate-binding protein DctP [Rhodoferax sp.]